MLQFFHKEGGMIYLCQIREAKTKPFKVWCYICKRYVLHDTKHFYQKTEQIDDRYAMVTEYTKEFY